MKISLQILVIASLALGCGKKDEKKPAANGEAPAAKTDEKKPVPKKPAPKVVTSEVTYKVGDTEFRGYLATGGQDSAKRPGVLVVHEWWGHNDYARKRARMLADLGYTALAIDMYGEGKQASHPKDAMAFVKETMKDRAVAQARFAAGMELLKKHERTDSDKIAAIGYCFGGAVVLEMAKAGLDMDLVASFHGALSTDTTFEKGAIKGKVFVAHGAADSFIKPEVVDAFKKQMTEGGVDMTFTAYEGAKHAFTNPDADLNAKKFDIDLGYDAEADKKSWATLTEMLTATFGTAAPAATDPGSPAPAPAPAP